MPEPREVDFLDPQILSSPFEFYAKAFESHPVIKIPGLPIYAVFSYELVTEVMDRVGDFSSNFAAFMQGRKPDNAAIQAIMSKGWPFVDTLLTADPPVHTRYRKLVNLAFSGPRINKMEAKIRSLVISLLESIARRGACDFVTDFALPFPIQVISETIGIGEVSKAQVKKWSDAISDRIGGLMNEDRELQSAREVVEFQQAMMGLIADRRRRPQDDLLTDLVNVQVAGERPLSDVEVLSILQQIIPAGNESSTVALTRGLLLLIKNPDVYRRVQEDFALIPNMIEEMMRIEAPAQGIIRITARDTRLGGFDLPAGAQILVRVGAANRDPRVFKDPEKFDIERRNARSHLSFGRGHHGCLGMMLARKELTIAYEEIMARFEGFRIVEGSDLRFSASMITPSLRSLPITFRSRARAPSAALTPV
jgi:cytochrome P450